MKIWNFTAFLLSARDSYQFFMHFSILAQREMDMKGKWDYGQLIDESAPRRKKLILRAGLIFFVTMLS
jgi:hypothetical protein